MNWHRHCFCLWSCKEQRTNCNEFRSSRCIVRPGDVISRLQSRALVSSLLLLLVLLGVCGCFRTERPADLVIVNGNEPESLDPAIVTGVSEMRITKALFEGLLHLEPTSASP